MYMGVVDGIIVLSCNFWTKDTWFALAELAFSHVWLVAHSTYGPCTIYTFGVWKRAWPQNLCAHARLLAPLLSIIFRHLCYSLANQEIHIRMDFFLFPLMKNMQRCWVAMIKLCLVKEESMAVNQTQSRACTSYTLFKHHAPITTTLLIYKVTL